MNSLPHKFACYHGHYPRVTLLRLEENLDELDAAVKALKNEAW